MDKSKSYLINMVGTCRNCVVDNTKEHWELCDICRVLVCPTHYNNLRICDLCKFVPEEYIVCTICDCPAVCNAEYDILVNQMAFSNSCASSINEVDICDKCRKNFINPHVYPNTNVHYQTVSCVINEMVGVMGASPYDVFRDGNELNYKLIQDGRDKILEHYRKTIPIFILPCIANIIIEYCGFARDIVFEEV